MKSYRFSQKEKDPVIYIAKTCIEIYASLHNMSFYRACKVIAEDAGVSRSCLNNWFNGPVRNVYFDTITRVVHATGREVKVDGHGMGSKARFKPTVIRGGKAA